MVIFKCSYRNIPRSNTDSAVKISNYEILRPDEEPEPGTCWIPMFDEDSNALGNNIGAVLSPQKAHEPYTKSTTNGILNIQNWFHIGIMF